MWIFSFCCHACRRTFPAVMEPPGTGRPTIICPQCHAEYTWRAGLVGKPGQFRHGHATKQLVIFPHEVRAPIEIEEPSEERVPWERMLGRFGEI
jgi:hypothetical protein